MCEFYSDADGPTAYCETHHRARKEHKCWECGGKIIAGETYVIASGVWDGRGDSFKYCLACKEVLNAFGAAHKGTYPEIGNLEGALQECVREETSWDDEDNEVLTVEGHTWQAALEAMHARKQAS